MMCLHSFTQLKLKKSITVGIEVDSRQRLCEKQRTWGCFNYGFYCEPKTALKTTTTKDYF